MCEKIQTLPRNVTESNVKGPRISVGVEDLFFNVNVNQKNLSLTRDRLFKRIESVDFNGGGWEILTEKEFTKKRNKLVANNKGYMVVSEKVGTHTMIYLFAVKSCSEVIEVEEQETLKWKEVYSVL